MTEFDVAVIGAGPGGYVCAIRAAQLGLKTCCIDSRATLGGTCLNVGCIPSKALLESSHLYQEATKNFFQHGISCSTVKLDLARMMQRKKDIVNKLTKGIAYLTRKNKIRIMKGTATIVAPGKVKVAAGGHSTDVSARHIVIASGSEPIAIPVAPFDGKYIVSSTEALEFTTVPERLAVIGGGVIGLEMASVWSRLGSEVTLIETQDCLIPDMDHDLSREIAKILQGQKMKIYLNASLTQAKVKKDKVEIKFADHILSVDKVLVAVGRRPYITGLGLDKLGLERGARGDITVDSKLQTNIPGIYAIGDVVCGPMLAHKAEEEGVAVAENIAGRVGHVNYQTIPSVIYTFPEIAVVGLSEHQVRQQVRISKFPFSANGRAMTSGNDKGFVKIIADATSDEILGCHIIGAQASELIAELVLAREYRASAEDIARTVHAHPTLAEAIKEAALGIAERVVHL